MCVEGGRVVDYSRPIRVATTAFIVPARNRATARLSSGRCNRYSKHRWFNEAVGKNINWGTEEEDGNCSMTTQKK